MGVGFLGAAVQGGGLQANVLVHTASEAPEHPYSQSTGCQQIKATQGQLASTVLGGGDKSEHVRACGMGCICGPQWQTESLPEHII